MRAIRYLPSLILFNSKWVYSGALSQQKKHSWEIPISGTYSDLHEDSSVLADRPCSLVNINDVSGDRGPSIFKIKQLKRHVPCTLGWHTEGTWLYCDYFIWCVSCTVVVLTGFVMYTEGTWLYCDYFIWCVSCTVVVLTGFVMCGCAYVWVCVCVCRCFVNMCTCIYCVLYCLYCFYVLFRLCFCLY